MPIFSIERSVDDNSINRIRHIGLPNSTELMRMFLMNEKIRRNYGVPKGKVVKSNKVTPSKIAEEATDLLSFMNFVVMEDPENMTPEKIMPVLTGNMKDRQGSAAIVDERTGVLFKSGPDDTLVLDIHEIDLKKEATYSASYRGDSEFAVQALRHRCNSFGYTAEPLAYEIYPGVDYMTHYTLGHTAGFGTFTPLVTILDPRHPIRQMQAELEIDQAA